MAGRRRAAACGLGARRRGGSGGVQARGSGLGATLGRGATNGGSCRGGAGMQWRLRGGVELAGVLWVAAAAFRGVGARREQKEERNRLLGSLRCSGAR